MAPQNFRPSDYSIEDNNKFVTLEWIDAETKESKYILERSADGGENFEPLTELPANTESYRDNNIFQGNYHYRIKAINGNEFSAYNNFYVDLSSEIASSKITFKVDLNQTTDLYEGGKVWVKFDGQQSWVSMTDDNNDKMYNTTISFAVGKNLKYYFIYQNGPDFSSDYIQETVPVECADNKGFRILQIPSDDLILTAVLFNSCQEALPPGIDITDLDNVIISGSNDDEPWIDGDEGAGSPPGERVEMLIDNNVETKYLVRAIDSWIEIETDTLSLVSGYTITSANDMPARDPRSWELLGWEESEQKWISLHEVKNNLSWLNFKTPRSWTFENDAWYKKYRLHITEINGDSQNLMQMAELQIWGILEGLGTGISDFETSDYNMKNYPNPFNKNTTISFSVPKTSNVKLAVYDSFGKMIELLIDEKMFFGTHKIEWNATEYSSGVYFYRISIDNFSTTRKLILNK
jgi:hypothetical protein